MCDGEEVDVMAWGYVAMENVANDYIRRFFERNGWEATKAFLRSHGFSEILAIKKLRALFPSSDPEQSNDDGPEGGMRGPRL